jgi:hypothetical protein
MNMFNCVLVEAGDEEGRRPIEPWWWCWSNEEEKEEGLGILLSSPDVLVVAVVL